MVNIDATTPQLQVLKNFIETCSTLNIDDTERFYAKDFKIQTFPQSDETPELTKEGYLKKNKAMLHGVAKAETTIHELIEAPGKVVFHATGKCHTVDGSIHDYESFCILTLVEEDGELKILHIKDFSNPLHRNTFHAGIANVQTSLSQTAGKLPTCV